MRNLILTAIISATVSYSVARVQLHNSVRSLREDNQEVISLMMEKVERAESDSDYRGEQFADLNARCYFALNQLDDIEHMVLTASRQSDQNKKDIDLIVNILQKMRRGK